MEAHELVLGSRRTVYDLNCPVLGKEYERVRAGKPPVRIDFESRYKLELPPASKKNDDAAWKQYLQKNQRSLQQKMIE
ncbi:hypothetical protein F2Q68_00032369 [Brassica cretica]|uniref:Uncharacterized protein n=1 Tax=Brassica cretica TaxID=69181 RepID=A0A8S9GDT0_BRACR|nr:hypothetical protein F2Q68_00032369 [Brassica cretica]